MKLIRGNKQGPAVQPGARTTMKIFKAGILACLIALAILINPAMAGDQNSRGCAWPIELSPEGFGNATMPETLARYFVMPFDPQYDTMTIKGTYPNARYFSFAAYDTNDTGNPVAIAGAIALHDTGIAPDQGSVNPFVKPGGSGGSYTVVIKRGVQTSGNTIGLSRNASGDYPFVWVLLRIYIPSADSSLSGYSLTGGVPLPTISLNGAEVTPCSPVNKLPDLAFLLDKLFPVDLVGDEGTPSSDRLWFAPARNPPMSLLPNPDNKYIAMLPGNDYQPGRIIVIHGKAPGTPNTYDGSPIWVPARSFRTVDMRYWSVCAGNFVLPVTTVGCTSDMTTRVEGGYYTIVISDDLLRPDWLRPNVNWLPWGDEKYLKIVFFRNMLPAQSFPFSIQKAINEAHCNFDFVLPNIPKRDELKPAGQCAEHAMGDYYPVAVWCDKSTFVHGGWQACINEQ
jgi:hypothetical protein